VQRADEPLNLMRALFEKKNTAGIANKGGIIYFRQENIKDGFSRLDFPETHDSIVFLMMAINI
jgi:hypothetical protein